MRRLNADFLLSYQKPIQLYSGFEQIERDMTMLPLETLLIKLDTGKFSYTDYTQTEFIHYHFCFLMPYQLTIILSIAGLNISQIKEDMTL